RSPSRSTTRSTGCARAAGQRDRRLDQATLAHGASRRGESLRLAASWADERSPLDCPAPDPDGSYAPNTAGVKYSMLDHPPTPRKKEPRPGAPKASAQSIVARTIGVSSPSSSAEQAASAIEARDDTWLNRWTSTQGDSHVSERATIDSHEQTAK